MSHFDIFYFIFFTRYCTKTAYMLALFVCLSVFSPHLVPWSVISPSMGETKQRDAVVTFDLEATVAPIQSGISSSLLAVVCH